MLMLLLGLAACLSVAAKADERAAPRLAFRIAPQPLDEALLAFAQQSGLALAAVGDLSAARRSGGVNGVMTAEAALQRLLAGSGYGFVMQGDGVVAVSTLVPQAQAHAPPEPALRIMPAPGTTELATVLVSARRREERWIDVPMAISVAQGDRIEALGLASAVDVLELMPGVSTVESNASFTQVQIRGVSSSLGGNDNGYYLDEVPFTGVTVPWHPDTRSFDVDKVEVLKGPQGTLFGEGSMGGTLRVSTRAPELDRFAAVAELGWSWLEGGGHGNGTKLMANVPIIDNRLALRAVATQESLPGWSDQVDGRRNVNVQRVQTQRARLRWSGSERWITDVGLLRTRADAPHSGSYAANDQGQTEALFAVKGLWRGAYLVSHLDLPGSRLTFLQSNARLTYHQAGDLTPTLPLNVVSNFNIGNTELRWTSTDGGQLDWLLGYAHRNAQRHDDLRIRERDSLSSQANRADTLFGEATLFDARQRWSLTAGLRYFTEDVSAASFKEGVDTQLHATFQRFVPRISLARHVSPRRMIYASRSLGFRSGQLQPAESLVAASEAGVRLPVTLVPDTVLSHEIGLKQGSANGRLLLQVSVFQSDWRDLPVRVPIDDVFNGLANSPGARLRGTDLELSWKPMAGLRLNLGGAWVDARYVADVPDTPLRRGTPVYNMPRLSVSGSVTYAWPVWRAMMATVAASARHHSRRETGLVTGTSGDPITVLDLRLGIESPRGWSWYLRGDNLGDERGAVDGRDPRGMATRLPPRSTGVEFHYRY